MRPEIIRIVNGMAAGPCHPGPVEAFSATPFGAGLLKGNRMDQSRDGVSGAAGRFTAMSPGAALILIVATILLVAFGLAGTVGGASQAPPPRHATGESDLALYRGIVARMRAGESYGHAAVTEQRARHYPLRPVIAIRPPTLATLVRWLPSEVWAGVCVQGLAVLTMLLWTHRLDKTFGSSPGRVIGLCLLGMGFLGALLGTGSCMFHETWAGVLVCLSLALRTEKRFVASAITAGLATAFRELALPYVLVMAVVAGLEGRRREALTFAGVGGVTLAYLVWTWALVSPLVQPQDLTSAGWVRFSGWSFVLDTTRWNGLVAAGQSIWGPGARGVLSAVVAPLCLLGAMNWRGTGLRLPAVVGGFAVGFMVIGRPDNYYWGLVTAPVMALGLATAPAAIIALGRRAALALRR